MLACARWQHEQVIIQTRYGEIATRRYLPWFFLQHCTLNNLAQPDEHQITLMRRTAAHITSSPNPEQLEMRILANHGNDTRFSFLRGRWKCAWIRLKEEETA